MKDYVRTHIFTRKFRNCKKMFRVSFRPDVPWDFRFKDSNTMRKGFPSSRMGSLLRIYSS